MRGGTPLSQAVDMVVGTSIGGIIALGIALGVPAATIRESIQANGPRLFYDDGSLIVRKAINFGMGALSLFRPKYSSKTLRVISEVILGGKTMFEAVRPLAVSSVCVNHARPAIFRNYGPHAHNGLAVDAALATSAAPTYFAPHWIGEDKFIDGGLVANNPDIIGYMDAVSSFHVGYRDIVVVSVGALNYNLATASESSIVGGLLGNFGTFRKVRRAIAFTLEVQQELSSSLTREAVGDRYIRISSRPSKDIERVVQLDRADPTATKTLIALAKEDIAKVVNHSSIRLLTSGGQMAPQRWVNGKIMPVVTA